MTLREWLEQNERKVCHTTEGETFRVFHSRSVVDWPALWRLSDYLVSSSLSGPSVVLVPRAWQTAPRVPCTGGRGHWPVFDRHGVRIHVGDTLRVKHCIGRYGQTNIDTVTVQNAHWLNCTEGHAHAHFDFTTNTLRCAHEHHDFEHGHETWAEVVAV